MLDEHGSPVLVDAQRVDPAPVDRPRAVLARQEADPQQRLHVGLDEALDIRLDLGKTRHQLSHTARNRVEQLQARHLLLLGYVVRNTERSKIVSATVFGPVKVVEKLRTARRGRPRPTATRESHIPCVPRVSRKPALGGHVSAGQAP